MPNSQPQSLIILINPLVFFFYISYIFEIIIPFTQEILTPVEILILVVKSDLTNYFINLRFKQGHQINKIT